MSTASDATKTGKLRLGGSNLWLFLLLASMILFGVNTGVATWQGSRLADAGSKAADLQVLSQQLANQGRDAVGGNAQAFTAFKATRNAIEQNVSTLQGRYGKEPGVSGAIATLGDYLTEVNVTSPTCVRELDAQYGLNIAGTLFDALEAGLR